ncbi:hypothetical protein WNY78_13700 [Psychroserpens sp. AS72]|uniref:hypothetical protein n=1 Tax=Psychroserpens sp. AS72 TaxID=3135775 RepID=UPI003176CB63
MPSIPCPNCKTQIEFDLKDILNSKNFTCTTCNIKITLSYEDNKAALKNAKEKLDELKDKLDID